MIKASIVLAMGLLAESVFRRHSASARHWTLACALVGATLVPALEFVVPHWNLPLDIPWLAGPAADSSFAFGDTSAGSGIAARAGGGSSGVPVSAWISASAIGAAWLAGAIVGLAFLGIGLGRLASIVSRARPVSRGAWCDALAELAGGSLPAPVRLLQSTHPALLFTWGLRRPAIVLPDSAQGWSAERIRAVLGHELAHVRRRDWAVQMAAGLVRCAYWFNPLVWLACHRLRQAGEQACDDAALSTGVAAPDYAAHVLDVARMFSRVQCRSRLPVMTMVRPSSFERRVRAMLDSRIDHSPVSRRTALAIVVALALAAIPLAGLVVQATPAPPATASVAQAPAATSPAPEGLALQQAAPASATSLSGTVLDASGKTMPDVVVDVVRVDVPGGPKPQMRTGADGRFEVTGLPPGEYEVASSKPGFKKNLLRVSLGPGAPRTLNVVMQIGSLSETITVTAGPAGNPAPAGPAARRVGIETPRPDPCENSPVGGCVTPPRKLVDVRPAYPPELAAKKATADVVVRATLRTDGFLGDFRPEGGVDAAFVEAVLGAIRQWEFTPVKLNGVPQECQVTVTIKFVAR
jgi:beta-lactamase regulating signal transducer with metallopeptidase domain